MGGRSSSGGGAATTEGESIFRTSLARSLALEGGTSSSRGATDDGVHERRLCIIQRPQRVEERA